MAHRTEYLAACESDRRTPQPFADPLVAQRYCEDLRRTTGEDWIVRWRVTSEPTTLAIAGITVTTIIEGNL